MDKVAEYFRNYPQSNECFVAGGFVFKTEAQAQAYAGTLKKGKVTRHLRVVVDTLLPQTDHVKINEVPDLDKQVASILKTGAEAEALTHPTQKKRRKK